MADVVLNLIYNDNGAGKNVDNLINSLKQMESKRYRISMDYAPVQSLTNEIEKATNAFERLKQRYVGFGGAFGSRGFFNLNFDSATQSLEHFSSSLEKAKREYNNLQLEARAVNNIINSLPEGNDQKKFSDKLDKLKNSIKGVVQDIELYKEAVNVAEQAQRKIGQKFDVSGAENSINTLIKKVISLQEAYQSRDFLGTFSFSKGPVGSQGQRGLANLTSGFYYNPTEEEKEQQRREESAKRMQEYDDANRQRMLNYERAQERHNNIIEQRNREQEEFEKRQAERAKQQAEEQKKRTEEQVRQEQEAARKINKTKEQIEKEDKERNDRMAEGNRKYWQGLSQIITGTIRLIEDSYNGLKTAMMAPLNLTGVSTVASMLESMEGSLLLNQISSNITTGFSQGVERFDILNTYPAVIEHLGYSSEEANASLDKLYQSVLGLPTAFSDIVENAQQFTLLLDDLDRATDLAIAANNAFVASGAEPGAVSAGMRQIQYLLEGTKLRNTQWYSLIRSMPIALKEVGKNLGYENFTEFTAALREGNIESEILIDNLIEVGLHSESLGNILDTMKSRVTASLTNVRNAATRLGDTLLETLDKTLQSEGGKGLTENIRGVSGIIDHIAEVASKWISDHGPELQALIDKFFNIDWASVVPGFLEGLVDVANRALDNIDTWVEDIGKIITNVRSLFSDIENSQLFVWAKNGMSIIGDIGYILGGFALSKAGARDGGSFGGALRSWFGGSAAEGAVSSGISIGSFLGYSSLAILAGTLGGILVTYLAKATYEWFDSTDWAESPMELVARMLRNSTPDAVDSAFGFIGGMMQAARENRLPQRYLRMQLYSGRISDFAERYGEYDFADSGSMMFLNTLSQYLSNFEIPAQMGDKINESFTKLSSDLNMIDVISKPYDDAVAKLDGYKTELLKRIDEINEEIAKRFAGAEINTYSFYEKIYNNGKKFFSKQYEEASGWSYSNTTKDRADTLEKLLPEATSTLNEITEYALANYSDDESVMAVVAKFMADFDYNDPQALAVLVKNYGGKDMQTVFEQYFEQQARNLDLDEAFRTALLQNEKKLTEQEVEGINIAQNELEEQKQTAIAPYVEQLETDIDALETDFDVALKLVEYKGGKLIDIINNLFDTLDSSGALDDLNDFFDVIERSMRSRLTILTGLFRRAFNFSSPSPVVQTEPYATGGFAPMGTDTIPAMLTPGEYVQRRAAVEHFGRQFMERINNLDLRGALRSISMNYATPYATGGFVRSDNRSYRDNHATVNQIFKSANASTGFRRASRFVRALG